MRKNPMVTPEERHRQIVNRVRNGVKVEITPQRKAFLELILAKGRAVRSSPEWKARQVKTGSCVHAWVSIETDARLKDLSKTTGIPLSAIVRVACETYLESLEEERKKE